jgi:hypothetical protein
LAWDVAVMSLYKGCFHTYISTDVLMYLNMKLYQLINELLYHLFIYKCTGLSVSMYVCIGLKNTLVASKVDKMARNRLAQ